MQLELLSINKNNSSDDCSPECLPFEESLNKDLKNAKDKTPEELDKEWEEYCEESKERVESYLPNVENLIYSSEDDDNDEYSFGEAIPTCNPWE